jgi:hypothetical protein
LLADDKAWEESTGITTNIFVAPQKSPKESVKNKKALTAALVLLTVILETLRQIGLFE